MTACFGEFQNQLHDIDWSIRRNQLAAIGSGVLFSLAIWLYVDTAATSSKNDWNNIYVLVTIASCVGMFMVNAVSNSHLQDNGYSGEGNRGARLWMMFAFILSFSALVAALWLMFADYVLRQGNDPKWPGVALFLNNFLIFCASLVYKFGRSESHHDVY